MVNMSAFARRVWGKGQSTPGWGRDKVKEGTFLERGEATGGHNFGINLPNF